jgi:hypothetical protein
MFNYKGSLNIAFPDKALHNATHILHPAKRCTYSTKEVGAQSLSLSPPNSKVLLFLIKIERIKGSFY